MTFLRNAWYAAGWDVDLMSAPIARTMLGVPLVIYRGADGNPIALADQCPHRFAPLSLGMVDGDTIRCPYHGLVFGKNGTCLHNPHGNGARPAALSVRSYPVRVQDGVVWVWMGEAEKAAGVQPPSFPFLEQSGWRTVRGYLGVAANYELVTDNLLDLSHVEFLHPFIAPEGSSAGIRYSCTHGNDEIGALHDMPDSPNTPLFQLLMGQHVTQIDGTANSYWQAPANLRIVTRAVSREPSDGGTAELLQAHLLTPETENSTHYFWAIARDRGLDDMQLEEMLQTGIDYAFKNEDEPMIQAVQNRMGGRELFELGPALLPMDEASVRARRHLAKLIAAEQTA